MEDLVGKRKKKRPKCANPLFEKWLQEWTDEAAEKGWKSQYTYGKALKTLRQFPLHLASGKDCKILQHFGDKICKMLDDKLAQHVASHGNDFIVPAESSADDDDLNVQVVETTNLKQAKKPSNQSTTVTHDPMDTFGSILVESDDENNGAPTRKRRKSGNKRGREYVPALRSGAYAILLALYRNMQDPDTRGFMTKAEITRDAQPLADKSFSVPDPGCRYTAWSAMGNLIKKGLVIKESNPAKYSLSDAGCELAHRMEAVDNGTAAVINNAPARVPPLPNLNPRPSLHTMSDSEDDDPAPRDRPIERTATQALTGRPIQHSTAHSLSDSEGEITPAIPASSGPESPHSTSNGPGTTSSSDSFRFWYVTEDSRLVVRKDEAAVLLDDVISIGFLIKCNYQSLLSSGKRYKLDTTKRITDEFVFAFLCDSHATDTACPPTETDKQPQNHKAKSTSNKTSKLSNKKAKDPTVSLPPGPSETAATHSAISSKPNKSDPPSNTLSLFERLCGTSADSRPPPPRQDDEESLPDVQAITSLPSSQSSTVSSSVSSAVSTRSLPSPDFTLRPGTFDVVLCVDNREFYGGSKCQSKTLLPDLIKNGVECDLRELQIGDMLWIARERVQPLPGQLEKPKGRELVIDFIVERKRMDDLVSSMIDGRFREQKFRLKRSGIANAIYLIEDHGSLQHFSIAEERIKQAMVNTQVIDGFKIKRTSGVKETVAYLTVMTRYLQSFYRNKSLQACTPEMLRELDSSFHIEESEKLLTTFQHFNLASVKSKDLTVREMFGKQLVQLHGMSADKAKAITDRYPTPTSLFEAYNRCVSDREKEGLLANIKCGKGMRNLGNAQSKQIYQLYCTNTVLT